MSYKLAPSILSANFGKLYEDIDMINKSEADWFHVDVMDGVFVPNISFGFPVMKVLKERAKKPLDVHLMIIQPEKYIERFAEAGADVLTVHFEACTHLHRTVQEIKANGMKAGVSINPHYPISVLENIIEEIDLVLIMSVNPGFGGQKFIPFSLEKIKTLREMANRKNQDLFLEVDGGVSPNNAREILDAGANVLVAGNAVFSAEDPLQRIKELKAL